MAHAEILGDAFHQLKMDDECCDKKTPVLGRFFVTHFHNSTQNSATHSLFILKTCKFHIFSKFRKRQKNQLTKI